MNAQTTHRSTCSVLLVTAGIATLGGCTSWDVTAHVVPAPETNIDAASTESTTDTSQAITATDAADEVIYGADTAYAPVVTTDSRPVQFAEAQPWDATTARTSTVGLFGELANGPLPASGQFDGASNLAQITVTTEGASFDPDLDRTGKTLVFASTQHRRRADIYIKSVSGRTLTQVTSDPADDVMPAFAPDGHGIAFASNRAGNWDIYCTTVNGDPPVQLTFDRGHELHPTWSPDGTTIAYSKLGAQSGRWEIWVVDAQDASAPRFLEYGLFPQWNPDPARSKIAFQRARERGSRLFSVWTIDYVAGEALHPTEIVSAGNAATMHPAWSPDGKRLVFVTVVNPDGQSLPRPSQSDVWVVDVDGTNRTNLTNGRFLNLYPTWGADGSVYFLSDRSGADNIWAVATDRAFIVEPPTQTQTVSADPALQLPAEEP